MQEPKPLFDLFLVRHGQSAGNAGISGDTVHERQDPDLSADGCRQADLLAKRFCRCPLDAIFSSGLLRAVHTACAVSALQPSSGTHSVEVLPLLTECNIRENYTGHPIEAIQKMFPTARFADGIVSSQTVLPNDEQTDEAYNIGRADDVLAYFKKRFQSGERILAAAHGIFNTVLLMRALEISDQRFDPDFLNASVTRLTFYRPGTGPWGFDVRLRYLNDVSHLLGDFPDMRSE